MFIVRKKKGKIIEAFLLGEESTTVKKLMEKGSIKKCQTGYEVFSRETLKSEEQHGEKAGEKDYIKIDEGGYPYPNEAEYFQKNHKYIKENCVRLNIKILNFSVGYLPYSDAAERVKILKLIDELWDMGVVVVAAAGNYGPAPFSVTVPGISRKIITVGSFDDIRSGKGPTDCCIVKPEILAPGHDIISLGTRDGTYVRKTGTSMATPIVSGAIALLLEKNPNMRPEEVKLALYNTCDRAGDSRKGSWGIINVDKLVGIL